MIYVTINPERVTAILEAWALKDVTPTSDIVEDREDVNTSNRIRNWKKPVFSFSIVDIPETAQLTFIRDQTITCRIVGDRE